MIDTSTSGPRRNSGIRIKIDPRLSPVCWASSIISSRAGKSAGLMLKYLVAAVLQKRFPSRNVIDISDEIGHMRQGTYSALLVGSTAYYIAAKPTTAVLRACKQSIAAERHPVLLVPNADVSRALQIARHLGLDKCISLYGIETYIALDVLMISVDENIEPFEMFKTILRDYNHRIEDTKAPKLLKVELS